MGGGKHKDDNDTLFRVIEQAPDQDDMIHCLCEEARFEVENAGVAGECTKLIVIGKLISEFKDLVYQIDEYKVIVHRFITEDQNAETSLNSKEAYLLEMSRQIKDLEELLHLLLYTVVCNQRVEKLRKRCLQEIQMTQLNVNNVTDHIINSEEFFQMYRVDPVFITSYVIPKLKVIEKDTKTLSEVIIKFKNDVMCQLNRQFLRMKETHKGLGRELKIKRLRLLIGLKGMAKRSRRLLVKILHWPLAKMSKMFKFVKKRVKSNT